MAQHLRALLPVIFITVLWVCCEAGKMVPYVQRSERVAFSLLDPLNKGHIHL